MIGDSCKEGRTIVKRKQGERREKMVGPELPPPPLPSPHSSPFFYPGAFNAICTANGGHFARARRRTKTPPDPWSMGALRGAILGDVAATPKMAGAGTRGWDRTCKSFCTLEEPA